MRTQVVLVASFALLGFASFVGLQDRPGRLIEEKLHHLGNDATPDWPEAPKEPEGTRLDVRFESRVNAAEWTLFVRQRSVDKPWRLKINGLEIALLKPRADLVEQAYALPPRCIKDGENALSIEPDDPGDDIVVGELRLVEQSLRELYHLRKLRVRVSDAKSATALAARVTFVDAKGALAPIFYAEADHTAVRDGVIYVAGREAVLELPAGSYTSYATRGSEWSVSTTKLTLGEGPEPLVEHALTRELDTAGFVAADTHIHTLQFSGHGDSSALERQVTLAGEGVELAIATDHNHNTDYAPFQSQAGVGTYFTAVVGNEVTTEVGHFNGFPLRASDAIPPHDSKDFVKIVEGIREKGAKVVILNHPRWPSHEEGPFGVHHIDHLLGTFDPPLVLTVDATEMINSTTEEKEPMLLFHDWFALLNRGQRIFAIGSSDSHTVGDPVGQGRTYVTSATDDPTKIDVDAACDAIKNGHTSIGMGMFATVKVNGRWTMGETTDATRRTATHIELRVQAPSWIRPRKATVFANGTALREREIEVQPGKPTDARIVFDLQWTAGATDTAAPTDKWIVCVVTGDGVDAPYWKTLNPYTLAATNPVFLDLDGNGWLSPLGVAQSRAARATNGATLGHELDALDDATSVLLLDEFIRQRGAAGAGRAEILQLVHTAADRIAEGSAMLKSYLERL